MMTENEISKLDKNIIFAIKWAATEYKYIFELEKEFNIINQENDSNKKIKELKKSLKILCWIIESEIRTNKYEEEVKTNLIKLYSKLNNHIGIDVSIKNLIEEIRIIVNEFNIEHKSLLRYSSFYEDTLKKNLNEAIRLVQLEENIKKENPQKSQLISLKIKQLVNEINEQIKDADKWIKSLKTSLEKAKQICNKLKKQNKFSSSLMKKIKSKIGFPFGIRATAKSFYINKNEIPFGNSGSEGINISSETTSILHFFLVDEQAIKSLSEEEIDEILFRTIKMAIVEYSNNHATKSYSNFKNEGYFLDKDLPVLFFFPIKYYSRDRYEGKFSIFDGKPTFPEGDTYLRNKIEIKEVFEISFEDYKKIDPLARAYVKKESSKIKIDLETANGYLKYKNIDSIYRYYDAMYDLQKSLGLAVLEKDICKKPTKDEIKIAIKDISKFILQFNKYYKINFIFNLYNKTVYKLFADKIIEKIKNQ